jgi:hypothetical protein
MEPLAHNPSSKLLISGFDAICSSVHKATRTESRSDGDRLPPSIVGIGREGVGGERVRIDVELEIGVVEIGGRTLAGRIEDWVRHPSASVVGNHFERVRWVFERWEWGSYTHSQCIALGSHRWGAWKS